MAMLRVLRGPAPEVEYRIVCDRVVIGRDRSCGLRRGRSSKKMHGRGRCHSTISNLPMYLSKQRCGSCGLVTVRGVADWWHVRIRDLVGEQAQMTAMMGPPNCTVGVPTPPPTPTPVPPPAPSPPPPPLLRRLLHSLPAILSLRKTVQALLSYILMWWGTTEPARGTCGLNVMPSGAGYSDYTTESFFKTTAYQPIVITPGRTRYPLEIRAVDDTLVEQSERLTITLKPSSLYQISDPARTITILDDEWRWIRPNGPNSSLWYSWSDLNW